MFAFPKVQGKDAIIRIGRVDKQIDIFTVCIIACYRKVTAGFVPGDVNDGEGKSILEIDNVIPFASQYNWLRRCGRRRRNRGRAGRPGCVSRLRRVGWLLFVLVGKGVSVGLAFSVTWAIAFCVAVALYLGVEPYITPTARQARHNTRIPPGGSNDDFVFPGHGLFHGLSS